MSNNYVNLITRENITFLLACIGSLGTLTTGLLAFLRGRKNLSIEIIDYSEYKKHIVTLYLFLENRSSNPLCISSICLKSGEHFVYCELLEMKIISMAGSDILYLSPRFPLNLSPHVGYPYFIQFLECQDIALTPGKTIFLEFHTNRGVISKSLLLPDPARYLNIDEQCQ